MENKLKSYDIIKISYDLNKKITILEAEIEALKKRFI